MGGAGGGSSGVYGRAPWWAMGVGLLGGTKVSRPGHVGVGCDYSMEDIPAQAVLRVVHAGFCESGAT